MIPRSQQRLIIVGRLCGRPGALAGTIENFAACQINATLNAAKRVATIALAIAVSNPKTPLEVSMNKNRRRLRIDCNRKSS